MQTASEQATTQLRNQVEQRFVTPAVVIRCIDTEILIFVNFLHKIYLCHFPSECSCLTNGYFLKHFN